MSWADSWIAQGKELGMRSEVKELQAKLSVRAVTKSTMDWKKYYRLDELDAMEVFEEIARLNEAVKTARTAALNEAIEKFYKLDLGVMAAWDIERVLKELRDGK